MHKRGICRAGKRAGPRACLHRNKEIQSKWPKLQEQNENYLNLIQLCSPWK